MINSANRKRVEALVKRSTKHGQAGRPSKSPTYLIWQSMIGRCHRPSDSSYKWYGAKGVTVCDRWRKFENFFEDMGTAPIGTHIHRRNDATIYSKETCKWLSEKEHIGLHNQQRGWGARLNKAQLIDRVVALQEELAAERQRREQETENLRGIIKNQVASIQQRLGVCEPHWTEIGMSEPRTACPFCELLSALAAIDKALRFPGRNDFGDKDTLNDIRKCLSTIDLTPLHDHDAELLATIAKVEHENIVGNLSPEALARHDAKVRGPLLEALEWIKPELNAEQFHIASRIDDVLAKVKEQ